MTVRRRAAALVLAAALAGAVASAAASPAAALPRGPPPTVGDCLGWQGPGLCVYDIGYISFRLSKRVLHVGDTVSGAYAWGFSSTRSGRFLSAGAGLRLQRCSGDKVAGLGSSGSRTCTWKAVSPTAGWVTSLGMTLFQNASLGAYTENDFYVVLGREKVIEGEVTRERTENNRTASRQGIANVTVKLHGPQSKTVKTNANGYFVTTVRKSGRYRLTPQLPGKYGGRGAIRPASKVVAVSDRRSARADFTVADDLKVTLRFDRDRVPATGLELVTGTIRAERFGEPVPNLVVSVIPFRRSVAMNPEEAPVPAHVCDISWTLTMRWPTGTRGQTGNVFPFDQTTDERGERRIAVQLGTVPGTFVLQVWAKDDAGRLRYEHISDVSDTATIVNERTGTLAPAGLTGELANVATAQALTLPSSPTALAEELSAKLQRGLAYTPIRGSSMTGLLVYPAAERPAVGANATVGANGGVVLAPDKLNTATSLAFGRFAGAAKGGQLPAPPTFGQWVAGGGAQGWALTPQDGTATIEDDLRGWRYLGFPYPKAGGC